jgi:hypothetical protein
MLRKHLISYYKTSGITCLQKHGDACHLENLRKFEGEANFVTKGSLQN